MEVWKCVDSEMFEMESEFTQDITILHVTMLKFYIYIYNHVAIRNGK
jgi:hypothetical protein